MLAGAGPGNYSTIQGAINDAANGDTVYVYNLSSPYQENLVVNKSLTILGEDESTTIIQGSGLGYVITLNGDASSARISDFTIQNSDTSGVFVGFNLSDVNISHNIIQDCQFGIHGWHATTPHITDNIIRYNAWGILFEFTDHGQINLNHIMNNSQYGIVIDTSPVNRIYSNNISGNGVGIIPVRCLQNEIYQNNFMNNQKNQATWKNSYSKWHDNYWSDLSQHLIKTTYLIFGALVYEATGQKLPWIQLDSTPHQTPWVI